mmetsp:Transcript_27927/g.46302  ORF Transcript_27927/g.46302 Transcript_27927/m.46302 type:complete len:113 (+) Transcript_27927:1052-1390(+)
MLSSNSKATLSMKLNLFYQLKDNLLSAEPYNESIEEVESTLPTEDQLPVIVEELGTATVLLNDSSVELALFCHLKSKILSLLRINSRTLAPNSQANVPIKQNPGFQLKINLT